MKEAKAVHTVQAEQEKMHGAIMRALNEFSEATGFVVTACRWGNVTAQDYNGDVSEAGYWAIRSEIATGLR